MRVSASAHKSAWVLAFLKSVPVGKVNVILGKIFSHPQFALSLAALHFRVYIYIDIDIDIYFTYF